MLIPALLILLCCVAGTAIGCLLLGSKNFQPDDDEYITRDIANK